MGNQRVLVVGASSGVGHALAEQLVKEGHQVESLNRSETKVDEVATHKADVCEWDQDLPALEEPLDGLVYLPGTINLQPFKNLKLEDYRKDWEINFLGAARVIRNYLPLLQKSQKASVVLMSTVAVSQGMQFHASVAGAKAAVEGLVRSLAAEFAPKIRFNAVAPSLSDTPLASNLLSSETKRKHADERHPLQRIGSPEDLANAIAFLLSDRSDWVTGQVLHVDGGLSSLKLI